MAEKPLLFVRCGHRPPRGSYPFQAAFNPHLRGGTRRCRTFTLRFFRPALRPRSYRPVWYSGRDSNSQTAELKSAVSSSCTTGVNGGVEGNRTPVQTVYSERSFLHNRKPAARSLPSPFCCFASLPAKRDVSATSSTTCLNSRRITGADKQETAALFYEISQPSFTKQKVPGRLSGSGRALGNESGKSGMENNNRSIVV